MIGESITFRGGAEVFEGYLSRSVTGTGKGVIVLQEWWGLVEHIRDVCDRLANAGFTALAPDLYRGVSTVEPDEAASLMMALRIDQTERILRSAIQTLLEHDACSSSSVGVVGFCMGGQLAMFAAAENPTITAAANFYGIHPNVHPNYGAIRANVLGIFAEHDDYASPAAVAALDRALTNASVAHTFRTFRHCHHAFFNDTRKTVYDADAAQQSWTALVDHFDAHID